MAVEGNPLSVGAGISLLIFIFCISYPLFIYSWIKLNNFSSSPFFEQRSVNLIVIQTIFMFILSNIITPIGVLYEDTQSINLPTSVWSIFNALKNCLLLGIFLIITIRVWSVNFHYFFQLEMVRSTWKSKLSLFSIDSSSFYVRRKSTLGSLSWLTKTTAILYTLFCVLFYILAFINESNQTPAYILLALLFLITIIVIIILWCKFDAFQDHYHIRQELKESLIFSIFVMVFGVSLLVIMNSFHIVGGGTFGQYTGVILSNGLLYILILRVINANKAKNNAAQHNLTEMLDEFSKFSTRDVLLNEFAYEQFMNSLIHEFSSENLLFVTEYLQFRNLLNLTDDDKQSMKCTLFDTAFSNKINDDHAAINNKKDFMLSLFNLYTKYIESDIAPFEINISHEARIHVTQIIDVYNDENNNEYNNKTLSEMEYIVIPLLEKCLKEVTELLRSFFMQRFKNGSKWIEICNVLSEQKSKELLTTPRSLSDTASQKELQQLQMNSSNSALSSVQT